MRYNSTIRFIEHADRMIVAERHVRETVKELHKQMDSLEPVLIINNFEMIINKDQVLLIEEYGREE